MADMTAEDKQALADRDWWREFGGRHGWRLYGWTYRDAATFITSEHGRIEISGEQKEVIDTVITEAVATERAACISWHRMQAANLRQNAEKGKILGLSGGITGAMEADWHEYAARAIEARTDAAEQEGGEDGGNN